MAACADEIGQEEQRNMKWLNQKNKEDPAGPQNHLLQGMHTSVINAYLPAAVVCNSFAKSLFSG